MPPDRHRSSWHELWRTTRGVARSLRIYYGNSARRAVMDRFYAQFVQPGDMVFDVGAHVGDRVAAFRRLGAHVVAVEPQPALVRTLKLLYGRDAAVAIEPVAVGREAGMAAFSLNLDNPTVSTASEAFRRAADGAPGWKGQAWTTTIEVPVTTLDTLVLRHGPAAFIKIDVEGSEADALAGLSSPSPALSFEFTTIQPRVAATCIKRCAELGYTRYNAVLGESLTFVHDDWMGAEAITAWVRALPQNANSGDIYARLPAPL
ncbi:MAG: FkbM family methyltransferase [Alphaproteobacteria bacterium]|jgi:FkbM family methyltransferase|nr:MAG: FkbM family methyltransferase [Alphaproteobacteria bacterium]TMJ91740.1 MAG: FkbM family methyltransferase [Alphaproteobacteria bacterium]TMK02685.1 MAG: FkbM family methyltransferase [Alphaproteobacteria bacterium]